MSRRCRSLPPVCSRLSKDELIERLVSCYGKREAKKILDTNPTKTELCRIIMTSRRYHAPEDVSEAGYRRYARISPRVTRAGNILDPLIKPRKDLIEKSPGNFGMLRIFTLASIFKKTSCFYYPCARNSSKGKFQVRYTVENEYDQADIDRTIGQILIGLSECPNI